MVRILAISLLLVVVYSWEELKFFLRRLAFSIFKGKNKPDRKERAVKIDQRVSTLIIFATVPIGLLYFFANAENLFAKFLIMGLALLLIAAAAITSEILLRRARYETPLVGIVSFFAPWVATVAETIYLPRRVLAKLALLLALPPLLGLVFHYLNYGSSVSPELLPHMDILIVVLVGSLLLRIAIEFLEHYFHLYNLERLFSYYRVVLGIVLAIILLEG